MPKLSRRLFIAFLLISRPYRALYTLVRDTKIGGRYTIAGQRRTLRLYWRIMRFYDGGLIYAPHLLNSLQRQLEEWHVDQQTEAVVAQSPSVLQTSWPTIAKEELAMPKHPFEHFFADWPDSELRELLAQHKALAELFTQDNKPEWANAELKKAERLKELLTERQKHSHDLNTIWKPDVSE
jgi:hypothetical protein